MSSDSILEGVVRSIMEEGALPQPDTDDYDHDTWLRLTEAGLHSVGIPENAGGNGGDFDDLRVVVRAAGYSGAPLPLVQNWMAEHVLAAIGAPTPESPKGFALIRQSDEREVRVAAAQWYQGVVSVEETDDNKGTVSWIPDEARSLVSDGVDASGRSIHSYAPDAGHVLGMVESFRDLEVLSAFLGAVNASGGMRRIADLTKRYVWQREQFGRPIARFQAVQAMLVETHELALLTEVALDEASASLIAVGPRHSEMIVAAALVLTAECASEAAAAAHQAHGAIGFTAEHPLSTITRQLHAWRDADRSDVRWSEWLGRHGRLLGGAGLWAQIARHHPSRRIAADANVYESGSR